MTKMLKEEPSIESLSDVFTSFSGEKWERDWKMYAIARRPVLETETSVHLRAVSLADQGLQTLRNLDLSCFENARPPCLPAPIINGSAARRSAIDHGLRL